MSIYDDPKACVEAIADVCRMAKDRHFKIHGGRPEERVSDQTIQKHAEEGKQ